MSNKRSIITVVLNDVANKRRRVPLHKRVKIFSLLEATPPSATKVPTTPNSLYFALFSEEEQAIKSEWRRYQNISITFDIVFEEVE